MYVVTVTFALNPGHAADFLPLMRRNAARSLADEPGCHQFDVCTDPEAPDTVFLYELYTDRAAFDAHLQADHFKSFDSTTRDMVSSKQVRTYQRVTS